MVISPHAISACTPPSAVEALSRRRLAFVMSLVVIFPFASRINLPQRCRLEVFIVHQRIPVDETHNMPDPITRVEKETREKNHAMRGEIMAGLEGTHRGGIGVVFAVAGSGREAKLASGQRTRKKERHKRQKGGGLGRDPSRWE